MKSKKKRTNLPMLMLPIDKILEQMRECLDSGWTGMGFKTVEFEEKWKEYTDFEADFCIVTCINMIFLSGFYKRVAFIV